MVMASFEVSIQDIFHGCDEESLQQQQIGSNGPFSAATRSYLVDCILQEIGLDDLVSAQDVKDMAKDFKKLASAKSESENKKGLELFFISRLMILSYSAINKKYNFLC